MRLPGNGDVTQQSLRLLGEVRGHQDLHGLDTQHAGLQLGAGRVIFEAVHHQVSNSGLDRLWATAENDYRFYGYGKILPSRD